MGVEPLEPFQSHQTDSPAPREPTARLHGNRQPASRDQIVLFLSPGLRDELTQPLLVLSVFLFLFLHLFHHLLSTEWFSVRPQPAPLSGSV